ncbi:hypothetical protein F7725_008452 [Dissostichus mawsoni]|uniref:Uncharacterized protein n=1 Tax=Dissostichus mawsoni TaxID=36200 RepID=A0A7J5Y971_DISMA|nr:hypothetical protein F7725_008452 [Dissostichus mawsoni]
MVLTASVDPISTECVHVCVNVGGAGVVQGWERASESATRRIYNTAHHRGRTLRKRWNVASHLFGNLLGFLIEKLKTRFPSDVGAAPVKQHRDGQEGEDCEEGDGEGERSGLHHERLPLHVPVDGRHRPGQADAQEHVDGVATGHVPDGGVGVRVLHRRYLTGKAEVRRQVSDDGGEHADDGDGGDEARPAVQVVGGRNAGKQNLPEDGEEVHDVVEAGRQTLLPALVLLLI